MKNKIIILILTVLIFGACKLNSIQSDKSYINISNIDNKKEFKGYIKQRPIEKLYFQTEGKIVFMPYIKGDFVRKGQVLARLDGISYKIRKEKFNFENEINYNIIIAPFDGYIEEVYKNLNSYILKKEPVLALYPTNKTEAETMIDARYINKVNLKEKAVVKHNNAIYDAKIANILKDNDNYIIELELNNLYKELKEGMNINVELKFTP